MPYRDPATESGLDAGIPQAEAPGKDRCARDPHPPSACTGALARLPENNRKFGSQLAPANTRVARKRPRSRFQAALDLARTFPFGVLAWQVCLYCYRRYACIVITLDTVRRGRGAAIVEMKKGSGLRELKLLAPL